jgi:plastocyanin
MLLASFMLAACGDSPPAQPTTPAGGQTGGPKDVTVDMDQFKYIPEEITVEVGSTVTWVNKEAPKHTVTEDGESFDSGSMDKDDTFSRKFDTPGTVSYFCKFHGSPGQGMIGKVIVVAGSGGAAATATGEPAGAATPTEAAQAAATATTPPAPPTATSAPSAAGSARFRDNLALSDQMVISVSTLPERAPGKALYAWITGAGGAVAALGRITPDANGGIELRYDTPDNQNLLSTYDSVLITQEDLEGTPTAPGSDVALSGQLPPQALVHIRHLLVSFGATPQGIGLEVGLLGQTEELRRHAEFMRDSQAENNLAGVKLHAEHLVNIIEGAKGPNYGDLDKNGQVTNPGDGFGLLQGGDQLGYVQGSRDHAELAAVAPDATEEIKLHAGHVGITAENVKGWVTTMRDKALEIQALGTLEETSRLVQEELALANNVVNGVDLKGDGQILPVPGSGGAITSYQHAQLMAVIPLLPGKNVGGSQGGEAQPTAAQAEPTATTAQAPPPAANEVKIDISEFKFGAEPATVKVGTKVTWTNLDTAPHTATADNNSFDSGTLQKGQSFSFTVRQAGSFDYYCALHGGPGKQGMASTLIVEP